MRILRYRPSARTTVAVAALVVAAGGIAFAAIPGPSGVIHGCFKKSNGQLRVIDLRGDCKKNETAISWNQRGRAGPRGLPGPRGPAGPKGDPGSGAANVLANRVHISPTPNQDDPIPNRTLLDIPTVGEVRADWCYRPFGEAIAAQLAYVNRSNEVQDIAFTTGSRGGELLPGESTELASVVINDPGIQGDGSAVIIGMGAEGQDRVLTVSAGIVMVFRGPCRMQAQAVLSP